MNMSNVSTIILPDDPRWKEPLVMGENADRMTPKGQAAIRVQELDAMREAEQPNANWKYASSAVAHAPDPWFKAAQAAGASNAMAQPMWFSPLHTPQNWQIASKRREIYQWLQLHDSEILTSNYTFKPIQDLEFSSRDPIEDTVTGGLLFENIKSESIVSGSGYLRNPVHFAVRSCQEKRCYEISATGYWRSNRCSEEHPMFVLDGKSYRRVQKLKANETYRRKKGVPKGGDKPESPRPEKFIVKKQTQDICSDDYLLAPTPPLGDHNIGEAAWLLGLYLGDGTSYTSGHSSSVSFTMAYNESYRMILEKELSNRFSSRIGSRKHGNGSGWRVSVTTNKAFGFFNQYISGKLSTKRLNDIAFQMDRESRLHLLGGYFDADGSFSKAEGKLIANNYSKDMADQIYWLLLSVGIRASLGRYPLYGDHYETDSQWVYRIFVPNSDVPQLASYMRSNKVPSDFKPKRSRELRFFYEEDGVTYLAQPIEYIKQFKYTGPGYDLQIDPERSFVASGYVTSNCRFFYENEPKVAAAIDFYSRFPMNGFKLECSDRKVLRFFEHHVVKRLNLNEMFKMISSEYFMLGDVFVHLDVDCPTCQGSGVDPDTKEQCDHQDGSFKRLIVLNPDWIEVQQSVLADEPAVVMIPDEELKRIVFYKQPKNVYDRIPMKVKQLVIQNKPIPLSNRTVSHLKHMPVPYGTYGTSLIRRLFTTLAYKTKLMTANWIVAERLILPVRVVKIGSDNRPATSADIADIQQQLGATANDPNLTIVTHHNFEYEWYGASGKILQVTQEMEFVGKEILDGFMLNQSLLNGEMCIPQEDRILTKDGFKNLDQITDDDEVATYNKDTGMLEYQKPTAIHSYDWDGDLIRFQTDRLDFACTPNHRMLFQKRGSNEWFTDIAENVKDRARFKKSVNWFEDFPSMPDLTVAGRKIPFDDIVKIIAYYVSEGHIQKETRKNRLTYGEPQSVHISQSDKGKGWKDLCDLRLECDSYNVCKTKHGFAIHNKKLAEFLNEQCGHLSHNKRIPQWIKDCDKKTLQKLLGYLINGDGAIRTRDRGCKKQYYTYYTKSDNLRDDVVEVALKCGYFPRFRKRRDIWEITFSDYDLGQETIPLNSKKHKTITKMAYKGKVWCVTVPNSYIVSERNGKLMISGNSGYQSAQVGVEVLIRRIESWRASLAEWAEEHIFKPIAEMQGFVDEEKSEEIGEKVFLYPTIKWNDLNLKDKNQWYQLLNSLHDKQLISAQTFLEELGLDWDQEVKRQRYEQTLIGPGGGMLGQQGGAGGGMGGAMGGGGGGAPGGEMGGGIGGMGAGGMGGDMGAGGMGAGGGMGGDMGAMAGGSMKVMKPGKQKGNQQKEGEQGPAPMMKLTSIEQKMAQMLMDLAGAFHLDPRSQIRAQFPVQNPGGGKPFPIDFAFPRLKLGIECLHPEEMVQTSLGSQKAKDIEVGDSLVGRNGDAVKVARVFRHRHKGQLLTIKPFGMLPIQVTSNHPMLACKPIKKSVRRSNRCRTILFPAHQKFVRADQLQQGDYLVIPKRHSDSTDIKILDLSQHNGESGHRLGVYELNSDFGWLLGLYAAEGSSNPDSGSGIEFSLCRDEVETIQKLQTLLKSVFGLRSKIRYQKGTKTAVITACSSALARFFTSTFGKGASTKRMPEWMMKAVPSFKTSFLEGYCTGDGCIRTYDSASRFTSCSRSLLLDAQAMAFSLGLWGSIVKSRDPKKMQILGREHNTKGLWELCINFFGQKKKQYREDANYFYVPVKKITSRDYDDEVINFETRGKNQSDHTFCVGNLVTHNCDGEVWHNNPEQAAHDKERDYLLAQRGWTILRFDDKAIEEAKDSVSRTISTHLNQKLSGTKTASEDEKTGEALLYTERNGELVDLYGNYENFINRYYLESVEFKC